MGSLFKPRKMNKRGNTLTEVFTLSITLFAFAFIFMVAFIVQDKVNDQFSATGLLNNSPEALEVMSDQQVNTPLVWDGVILTLLVGLWIVALIGAFLIDTHPVFFVISAILLSIYVVIGGFLSEAWDDGTEAGELNTAKADFPFTSWIFDNIILTIVVIGMSIIAVLYAKTRS